MFVSKEGELRKQLEGHRRWQVAGSRARKDAHEDERELFFLGGAEGRRLVGNRTSENTLAAQIERERDGERGSVPLSLSRNSGSRGTQRNTEWEMSRGIQRNGKVRPPFPLLPSPLPRSSAAAAARKRHGADDHDQIRRRSWTGLAISGLVSMPR